MVEPVIMTFNRASELVEALTASDKDWSYKLAPVPTEDGMMWSIEVYDEEGIYVSTFHKPKTDE